MKVSEACLSAFIILRWFFDVCEGCVDNRVCKYYKPYKQFYCNHQWLKGNCPKMCGYCTPVCKAADHPACVDYGNMPQFYCPHKWLKSNCNQMCGRCAAREEMRWPEGEYGILSAEKCPKDWFEFNHCMDSENESNQDDTTEFALSPRFNCDKTSISFRYCFKGPKVPTRKGGFWTKHRHQGNAFVVKSARGTCDLFGSEGGTIEVDNEDSDNKNSFGNVELNGFRDDNRHYPYDFIFEHFSRTRLAFCKIGDKKLTEKSSDYIEVGSFNNQRFGFFILPNSKCPAIKSPSGILYGKKQKFFSDDENYMCRNKVIDGDPPVVLRKDGSRWAVCQYDPREAKTY